MPNVVFGTNNCNRWGAMYPIRMPHPLVQLLPTPTTSQPIWAETETIHGITISRFRLETMRWQGKRVTTYGLYAEPPDGPEQVPAVLHLHGGGQTASMDELLDWVPRGYACLSFDWTGSHSARSPEHVAHYPATFPTGQGCWLQQVEEHGTIFSTFLHGLVAARQLLGMLANQPRVDANRLGAYGVSWGGFLTWLLNSIDNRLRAACAIYGTGGLHLPGHLWADEWARIGDLARRQWMSLIEPRGHLPFQHAPMAFLNATNDFFGGLDLAAELLPMLPDDWRADYSPNSDHHLSGGGALLLERWFGHYLCGGPELPATPELRVRSEGHQLHCETTSEGKLELWYSQGDRSHRHRCWHLRSDWQETRRGRTIALPEAGPTWLFLRRRFADGLTLSSAPLLLHGNGAPSAGQEIWRAPSRDGLGIHMRTQPAQAGDVEELYDLQPDGLYALERGDLLNVLLQLPPGSPAAAHLEIEADASAIELSCPRSGFQASTSERRLSAAAFQHEGRTLDSLAELTSLIITLKPPPGRRACLRALCWS